MSTDLLKGLNLQQQEAVTHGDGPCLVIAGAGTGKTGVITRRIAYLVREQKVEPEHIVALTYTDKAAVEMQERLDELLDYGTFVTTSTFHGFCNELIRRHAFRIGIDPEARLITEADQVAILREHLARLPLKHFRAAYNPMAILRQIARYVEQAKESLLNTEELEKHAREKIANALDDGEKQAGEEYLELARCYAEIKKLYDELGVLTYADLLRYARDILSESETARKEEQERTHYLLIDEFQDTNSIQAEIAYLLAGRQANLFVVGDDDQAIYRFRGANVKNILDFQKAFPDCKVVTLTENYRSSQPILDAAYHLIQHNNPHRLEPQLNISKKLKAQQKGGNDVQYLHFSTGSHEAEEVASTIQTLIEQEKYRPEDIAIIARTHTQLDSFEEELAALGIPINRAKQGNFFQEPSVVQGLAYLGFLSAPHNSENLFRLLTGAPFSVPGEDIVDFNAKARKRHQSLWEVLEENRKSLTPALSEAVTYYEQSLHTHAASSPSRALCDHINDSKWQSKLIESAEEQAALHLTTLYNRARTYELLNHQATIAGFVDYCERLLTSGEEITVESEINMPKEGVNLITAHSSKGLEYPIVFVVNLVLRRFPMQINGNDFQLPSELIVPLKDNVRYEEERRLAYVAFTRAKERLYLTDAERYGTNKANSITSPFITEALVLKEKPILADQPLRGSVVRSIEITEAVRKLRFPVQFTASALEAFEENPAKYYRDYVMQVIPEDQAAVHFGTAVHNTLRDLFNARRDKSVVEIEEIFKRYWVGEGYPTAAMRDEEYRSALEIIATHLKTVAEDFCPDCVEEPVLLQLSNGIRIIGKVDRIDKNEDGSYSIIDYKTGRREATEKDVEENLPLALYAAALYKQGKKVRDVSLYYLRSGSSPRIPVTQDFLRTQSERTLKLIEEMRLAYENRSFPENPKWYRRSRVR